MQKWVIHYSGIHTSTLIGARVADCIKNILLVYNIIFWTDSENVLHWIKVTKEKWKPFVANLISEIYELSDHSFWRHCDGKLNLTNLIARGCSGNQLINFRKGWYGPELLSLPEDQWFKVKILATHLPGVSEEQAQKAATILFVSFKQIRLQKFQS